MKKLAIFLLTGLWILGLHSCKKQQEAASDLSNDETTDLITTDATTDELMNTVETFFTGDASRSSNHHLPSCVTVTRVRHGDTLNVTWEFDPAGCQMPNGRTYTGTINILRTWNRQDHEFHLYVTFSDDFSVDGIDVDGGFERTHVRQNTNGNPETEFSFALTITRPNGDSMQTAGTRTREFAEGYNTPNPHDNVWLITGSWTTTRFNGDQYVVNITQPLRKEFDCRWYVSGTMQIVKNGRTFVLDFGNGTCDDEATLTLPNGQTRTIHLR